MGTLREYVGELDNLIDIKTGLSKKSILSKNYTKKEYIELLKNIEKHHIKLYKSNFIEELPKDIIFKLKSKSDEKLYKEINNLTQNIANILDKEKEDIDKYNNLLKSFTEKNNKNINININNNVNILEKEKSKSKNKNKINNDYYKLKFDYIKKFYITKFKKYLSIIKYGKNKKDENIKLNFIGKEDLLQEMQYHIYEENKKLENFMKDEIQEYFQELNVSFSNQEITSIYGMDNIYKSNYETIKKYSDFDFSDALNVLLYILVSDFNKLIMHYLCKDEDKDIDTDINILEKKTLSKFKSDDIYKIEIKNTKCKYIANFIVLLLDTLQEDKKILDECNDEINKIQNNILHDIIENKSKLYYQDDDDDYFTKMLKNKLAKTSVTIVDTVNEELTSQQEQLNEELFLEDIDEIIYDKGKKELLEKYGYQPSAQELEDYKENYISSMHDKSHYKEEAYDLFSTSKGIDVVDQGAGYGEFNEFDFETGDGFDYSE